MTLLSYIRPRLSTIHIYLRPWGQRCADLLGTKYSQATSIDDMAIAKSVPDDNDDFVAIAKLAPAESGLLNVDNDVAIAKPVPAKHRFHCTTCQKHSERGMGWCVKKRLNQGVTLHHVQLTMSIRFSMWSLRPCLRLSSGKMPLRLIDITHTHKGIRPIYLSSAASRWLKKDHVT